MGFHRDFNWCRIAGDSSTGSTSWKVEISWESKGSRPGPNANPPPRNIYGLIKGLLTTIVIHCPLDSHENKATHSKAIFHIDRSASEPTSHQSLLLRWRQTKNVPITHSIHVSLGIQSPPENGNGTWILCWEGDWTPQSLPENMTGCLGYIYLHLVDLYGKCRYNVPYMDPMGPRLQPFFSFILAMTNCDQKSDPII